MPYSHDAQCRPRAAARRALRIVIVTLLGVAAIAGCESNRVQDVRRFLGATGESDLKAGMRNFDGGRLTPARDNFNDALRNGLTGPDEVTANKYLAFIACSQKREGQCRSYFLRAMELDSGFDLTPAEAANPVWGPVFKRLKERR